MGGYDSWWSIGVEMEGMEGEKERDAGRTGSMVVLPGCVCACAGRQGEAE